MSLTDTAGDLGSTVKSAAGGAVASVTKSGGVVAALSSAGFRSEWAYAAGFASIGLSFVSHYASRASSGNKAQADRWGIFVGHWAPTFFALGVALRLEELS
ncbi:hypothetical protein [Microlunatus flavus]|uniref:Uncharacterized protein n=1 Tax=Microlunatus flavus TaxID=1036181 RepID=A0A1H9G6C9_9ACTN|nr:hypothetical protein [Microlunatus flavus]SEQ45560.1 hypothetical protein SAMN05421756_103512 [Microlunatus flavus]